MPSLKKYVSVYKSKRYGTSISWTDLMGDLVYRPPHFSPTVFKSLDIVSGENELLYTLLSRKKNSSKFYSPVSRCNPSNSADFYISNFNFNFNLLSEQRTMYYVSCQEDSYQITEKYFCMNLATNSSKFITQTLNPKEKMKTGNIDTSGFSF